MNFSGQAVQEYVTHILGLLCLPDMKVKRNEHGKSWTAQVDALALDFEAQRILLVEVTTNEDFPTWLVNKVKRAEENKTINWHLRTKVLKGKIGDDYKLVWLLITLEKHVAKLTEETSGYLCEVMSLENVLHPVGGQFEQQKFEGFKLKDPATGPRLTLQNQRRGAKLKFWRTWLRHC